MSLQTRLEALVAAIGADVKALQQAQASGGVTLDTFQSITAPKRIAATGTTKGTEYVAGTGTQGSGGAGQHHGALLLEPSASLDDQTALLIKAPDSGWGVGQGYAEGGAILYLNENRDVRFRVDRNGGVGTTGGYHAGIGANGGSTSGVNQAAWFDTALAPACVPLVLDAAAASTVSTMLARRGGVTQFEIDQYGNIMLGAAASIISVGNSTYICNNAYYDGTNWRARVTGTSNIKGVGIFGQVTASYASNSTAAGAIITWILTDGAEGIMTYRKNPGQTITGTTPTDVIVSDDLTAGQYAFEIIGAYRGSTTGQGLRPYVNVTATGAAPVIGNFVASSQIATAAGTLAMGSTTTNNGVIGAASASLTTNLPFKVFGSVSVTQNTTTKFTFRVASSTTGNIIIEAGTFMRITRMQS